jgi:hypothetical protein
MTTLRIETKTHHLLSVRRSMAALLYVEGFQSRREKSAKSKDAKKMPGMRIASPALSFQA